MPAQTLPSTAIEYAARQRREQKQAIAAVLRVWRRMSPADFDASYARLVGRMTAITNTAQTRLAEQAQSFIPDVLEDTGQASALTVAGATRIDPLVGVAGDGRPVDSLLYGGVTGAKSSVAQGMSGRAALRSSEQWLTTAVGTLLADTARQSESLGTGVRPVAGYVRMLEGASCARCVVLAGKWYRKNKGFERHPRCDCRHIPAAESVGGDMTVDPNAYFESLTAEEQDATFTAAGAEAIRNGADMSRVVNARRGMSKSQSGRLVRDAQGNYSTTAGTSAARRRKQRRPGASVPTRLMPESIAELATSRDEYLRLLRLHGYLL